MNYITERALALVNLMELAEEIERGKEYSFLIYPCPSGAVCVEVL